MFSFARPADMLIKETRGQNHKNKTCQRIFSKRQARNRKATTPQHIYHFTFTLFGSSQPIIPQQGPPPMRTLHHLAFVGKYPRNADRLCKISTANTNIETLKSSNHAVLGDMSDVDNKCAAVQLLQTKRSPIPIDADKHRPKAKCSFVVQALIPQTAHVE